MDHGPLQSKTLMVMDGRISISRIIPQKQMRFYLTMKENLLVKKKVVQKTISLNMQDMVLIIERVIQWILIKMVIKILL